MASITIKQAVAEALDELSEADFLRFCDLLTDRREEPRVRSSSVEGKRPWKIAEVLVSTFTEPKALHVAVNILRQMNCNEEAETLVSKTKACVDKRDPTLRKTLKGELELKASQEALKHTACRPPLHAAQQGGLPVKTPKEVEAKVKTSVLSEGGDPCNDRLHLSRCTLRFGKYKGQTFKWLLENDVGYAAFIVGSHQKEKAPTLHQDPLTVNKDSLTKYAMAYPEVVSKVRFNCAYKKAKERDPQPGREGDVLVGFGAHRSETLQDLYESKDPEKIRYVNYLRTMKSTCTPGSKMEDALRYIVQRDQEQATAAPFTQATISAPRGGQTKQKEAGPKYRRPKKDKTNTENTKK
uniref:uncharacterized protein n=1 Tax=Semicossyphus pulcher TaxID=241346 RepID=UPI0037E79ADA